MDSEGKALPQPEVISTKGLPLNDAVKKILGLPGTKVKLVIQREGKDKHADNHGRDPGLRKYAYRLQHERDRSGETANHRFKHISRQVTLKWRADC